MNAEIVGTTKYHNDAMRDVLAHLDAIAIAETNIQRIIISFFLHCPILCDSKCIECINKFPTF